MKQQNCDFLVKHVRKRNKDQVTALNENGCVRSVMTHFVLWNFLFTAVVIPVTQVSPTSPPLLQLKHGNILRGSGIVCGFVDTSASQQRDDSNALLHHSPGSYGQQEQKVTSLRLPWLATGFSRSVFTEGEEMTQY
jgi:hypothetical protein